MQKFHITKDNLPEQSTDVTFIEPTFGLRRQAAQKYPKNANYPLEDLLMGMSIDVGETNKDAPPMDPLRLVQQLPLADSQYLSAVFISMFTLDEDLADKAQSLGTTFKSQLRNVCTIPKDQMPIGGFSVTFRKPTLKDRHSAEQDYPGADSDCGYSLEELLFARSIVSINGEKPVYADAIKIMDEWPHLDAQFAVAVFLNSTTLSKSDVTSAKSLGKSLRAQMSKSPGLEDTPTLKRPKTKEALVEA